MTKYFITGGSGFIGSHFHDSIPQSSIVNFDLVEPKIHLNSKFIRGDVRKLSDIENALAKNKCDIIIALAAEHKDFGVSNDAYFATNEIGTENICKAASKNEIKNIIFYSSVAVYGKNLTPCDEDTIPNPNLPYGKSKLAGEQVLKNWVLEGPDRRVLIIRPTVVFGERNIANMFKLIVQIKAGKYFHIGKGNNIKSLAYVKNLVEATLFLINRDFTGIEVYNYSDNPQLTSREIANMISDEFGKSRSLTIPYWLAYILGLPFDFLIKISGKDLPISTDRIRKFCTQTYYLPRMIEKSGFLPKYTTLDGLKGMVSWYKNNFNSSENNFET
jgi:nucleoside-diphosphate-sugar epimerase